MGRLTILDGGMRGWWLVSYVVLWGVVALLAVLLVSLARQVGILHLRVGPRGALEVDDEGPPLGELAPPADLPDADGRPVAVGGPGEPQFLLFVSPGCPVCREVLPGVPAVVRATNLSPRILVDDDDPRALAAYAGRDGGPVLSAGALARAWGIPGTPFAIVLDETGVVRAKGTVNTLEQMEGLVDTAGRRHASVGDPHR